MLADELDAYKGKGNEYVDINIQEIQDLYKEKEEIILVKLYKVSKLTSSSSQISFITDEVKNLLKYMKFV